MNQNTLTDPLKTNIRLGLAPPIFCSWHGLLLRAMRMPVDETQQSASPPRDA
jgi:hypothetical protein